MATAPIAALDLRLRRKSLIGYSVGMAGYMLVIVALYPAFKNSSNLDKLTQSSEGVAALFGISGSITSPTGWISANAYANFFPLIVLLLTIGYGVAAFAGQERDGHLELILSLPYARARVAGEKIGVLVLQAVILSAVVLATLLPGPAFDLHLPLGHLTTATLGIVLLGVDFGLLAMALAASTGNRGSSLGITSAVAAASYLVATLAPLVHWAKPARYASLFYWSASNSQLEHGLGWAGLAILAGTGAILATITIRSFNHHDLRG
ncbi:MAG: ABC transporter permease subunit [Acidimicrobiales bacterium]|nr:ABC transporter permease subunit [Actinomycetota bacterium]